MGRDWLKRERRYHAVYIRQIKQIANGYADQLRALGVVPRGWGVGLKGDEPITSIAAGTEPDTLGKFQVDDD